MRSCFFPASADPSETAAANDAFSHIELPSPPPVPLLLCGKNGGIRMQNDTLRELCGMKNHSSLLPRLSPEDRRLFASVAAGDARGFLTLSLPSPSHAAKRKLCFLTALSSYRNAVVLLGLPFLYPPTGRKRIFSKHDDPRDPTPLTDAIAAFIASRFSGSAALLDPPAQSPWIDARALALGFEKSKTKNLRSVERNLRFLSHLFSFPELFPGGRAPEIDAVMCDPTALFLEHSNAALVLFLSLARFSMDLSDAENEDENGTGGARFSFYFQEERLTAELFFRPASSICPPAPEGSVLKKPSKQKASPIVTAKGKALEELYFPNHSFRGFSSLAPRHRLLLASLQNLCRRFGWMAEGGLLSGQDGRKELFLKLHMPVLHRKGVVLFSDRTDEHSDFLRFLSFLCPFTP